MVEEEAIIKLNHLRKWTICQYIMFYLFIPLISSILYLFTTSISKNILFLMITLIYLIFINYIFYKIFKPQFHIKYLDAYKKELLLKLQSLLHEDINVSFKGLEEAALLNTDFLPFFTTFSSKDLIESSVDNIPYQVSDVKFSYYRNQSKNFFFLGQWYTITFNKPFSDIIHLYAKGNPGYLLFTPRYLSPYTIDDQKFNQFFRLYTSNPQKTNILLNHHFRERIKLLTRKYKGRLILIFQHNTLHIGIDNQKSVFHPNLFEKLTQINFLMQIEDFLLIKNIIKYIKTIDKVTQIYLNLIQSDVV